MTDLNQACADADKRVANWAARSAGQHLRATRAPIVQTQAEQDYGKPLHGYVDLDQRNSDGTSPHDDVFSIVEILLVIVVLSSLTFCLSMLAGFFWSK